MFMSDSNASLKIAPDFEKYHAENFTIMIMNEKNNTQRMALTFDLILMGAVFLIKRKNKDNELWKPSQ